MAIYTRPMGTQATLSTTVVAMTAGTTVAAAGVLTLASLTPAHAANGVFTLAITFPTATGIENRYVELLARPMDVQAANDSEAPTTTFREQLVAAFKLKGVTTRQFITCAAFNLPAVSELYLFVPSEVGQSSSANSELYFTPYTETVA